MASQPLKSRLESLYRHLGEEGWHVHANTAAIALDLEEAINSLLKNDGGKGSDAYDAREYYNARNRLKKLVE